MRAKDLTIKQRYHFISKPVVPTIDLVKNNKMYPRNIFSKKNTKPLPSMIIRYAINNERATINIEENNTLTIIVDVKATKPMIKEAIETMFGKKVLKVNTLITNKHYLKKAFVRFVEAGAALDISSIMGSE